MRGLQPVQRGFTLIELSIVLVIIGLVVGGVLAGQDLIRAAGVRATVTQIERYNTAVNTFRTKYDALPGDLNVTTALSFHFAARGGQPGQGDGNGIIEGCCTSSMGNGYFQNGEILSFWADLTVGNVYAPLNINLIDGSFTTYANPFSGNPTITAANAASYYPPAKLGRGNFVYVYSTGSVNYFGIAPITATTGLTNSLTAGMTVQQAYQIDRKMDDGSPQAAG